MCHCCLVLTTTMGPHGIEVGNLGLLNIVVTAGTIASQGTPLHNNLSAKVLFCGTTGRIDTVRLVKGYNQWY